MQKRLEELAPNYANNMNFTVFSKTKFDENLTDEQLLEVAKKRFERSLPLHHIDIVLVQSLEVAKKRFERSLPLHHIDIVLVQSLEDATSPEDNADGAAKDDDEGSHLHETGSVGQKTNR